MEALDDLRTAAGFGTPPNQEEELEMIVIGVSSTVFVVLMVLGVLSWLADGAAALKRSTRRRDRVGALYSGTTQRNSTKS